MQDLQTDASITVAPGTRMCFHCGQHVPPGTDLEVIVLGETRPMCCHGCEAVARSIVEYGLSDFYRQRTEPAKTPAGRIDADRPRLMGSFDDPLFQEQFVDVDENAKRTADFVLVDVVCPACCWLIESRLRNRPGVLSVQTNYSDRRVRISWNDQETMLSSILAEIRGLGYEARPYNRQARQLALDDERSGYLRRLGIGALFGMQVMMISVALYFGDSGGMDVVYRRFLRWTGLLLTLPVLLYSARPFFSAAYRDLINRRLGMDVPVAIAITFAFVASCQAVFQGGGEVYFDSIVMFVFILQLGRFLEFKIRRHAALRLDDFTSSLPVQVTRLLQHGDGWIEEPVYVERLSPGDRILVRPGDVIPADGTIRDGCSSIDEAIISGESVPQLRRVGDAVIAGSVNIDSPLKVDVTGVGTDTAIAKVRGLAEQAQMQQPVATVIANRAAAWFIGALLLIAVTVAVIWWHVDPTQAVKNTIAVLIVTCPCALALAMPAAFTGVAAALTRYGLVPTSADAIEALQGINRVIFDKTGTLTCGELTVAKIEVTSGHSPERCLQLAASLEAGSSHPIARGFLRGGSGGRSVATALRAFPGLGVSGVIGGSDYFLGSARFLAEQGVDISACKVACTAPGLGTTRIWLATAAGVICCFYLRDNLRTGAASAIDYFQALGLRPEIFSGDGRLAVASMAQRLAIQRYSAELAPADKLRLLRQSRYGGERYLVVGDGINDAPLLAAADVAVAMGSGSTLAQSRADFLLLNNDLTMLIFGHQLARKTRRIIHQNIGWAVAYNLLAVPAAASGLISPWLAALGMSLSSLIVTLNSRRLALAVP